METQLHPTDPEIDVKNSNTIKEPVSKNPNSPTTDPKQEWEGKITF
jgi:hypothetical protein